MKKENIKPDENKQLLQKFLQERERTKQQQPIQKKDEGIINRDKK